MSEEIKPWFHQDSWCHQPGHVLCRSLQQVVQTYLHVALVAAPQQFLGSVILRICLPFWSGWSKPLDIHAYAGCRIPAFPFFLISQLSNLKPPYNGTKGNKGEGWNENLPVLWKRHALEVNRIMISIQQGAWCSKHDWNQSYFSYAWFIIRLQNSNLDSEITQKNLPTNLSCARNKKFTKQTPRDE